MSARATPAAHAAKWAATVRTSWSNLLAYPLNLLLLVIGPMLVFYFVRYNLWSAIFTLEGVTQIQGYDLPGMLRYQAWVLVVGLLAQGHTNMQISEDIRMGRISAFMIYPFAFWQFHASAFLAFQSLQTVVALITTLALRAFGILPSLDPTSLAVGLAYTWLVGITWFAVQFVLGLVSFWLEETWVLRVMFGILAGFLSGAMVPLELFPEGLRSALEYTPFPYLTWVPARILMGEYQGSIAVAALVLAGWLALVALLASVLWRRGVRLYTAAGM